MAGLKEKAQDDGHGHETLFASIASADDVEDEVEMDSIDARRDRIANMSVTDIASRQRAGSSGAKHGSRWLTLAVEWSSSWCAGKGSST